MLTAGDFRKGITFQIDGEPYVVLDFQHVKPGKGAAFVRTKYKNIITGAIREEAFNPNDKFDNAHIETKKMQYLYNDGELYYFMDGETYDQVPISFDMVEEAIKYKPFQKLVKFDDDEECIICPNCNQNILSFFTIDTLCPKCGSNFSLDYEVLMD